MDAVTIISSKNPPITFFECSDDLKVKKDDVLQFQKKNDGRIFFSKNYENPICIFKVKNSFDLWPFFKMGKVSSIELIKPKSEIFIKSKLNRF